MIRFAIIAVGIFMILQKLYKIIKRRIENYMDTSEKHFFNVQLASTKKEREIGLMYVKELPLDSGMLFEYPDNSYPSIWMKNTLIPLDAIFINKNADNAYRSKYGTKKFEKIEQVVMCVSM